MKKHTLSNLSDDQIISLFKEGHTSALGTLYERYYKKVYHKCISMLKNEDDAFDVAQDVLIKSFEKISFFKGNSTYSTWLFAITQNACLEFLRKSQKHSYSAISDHLICAEVDTTEEVELAKEKMEKEVLSLIDSLSATDKDMLIMKYQNKASIKEIQALFGLSSSAVKMRLLRARNIINQLYNQSQLINS